MLAACMTAVRHMCCYWRVSLLEGDQSPTLPGGQSRGVDDAELAAVEEQVGTQHAGCLHDCSEAYVLLLEGVATGGRPEPDPAWGPESWRGRCRAGCC